MHPAAGTRPGRRKRRWPVATGSSACAPGSGRRINPVDVTMALAKGARMKGAQIFQNTPVTGVLTRNGTVTGMRTGRGEIRSEFVVNCAGMWARQLGEQSGVVIPNQAPELRNYFVCAGLNSVGIITGGGYGRVLAHWILNGRTGSTGGPPSTVPAARA
ncbi:MAG: FAD-dependent oxidoreductase [Xanthomonadales bacterium]|nr:FAD-dependent oxidoreductase [Xanthomonadales bacterium]